MLKLRTIDQLAASGSGMMHKASLLSKILMAAVLIALALSSSSILFFAFFLLMVFFLSVLSRLPILELLHWAAYPLFFSVFFAYAAFAAGNIHLAELSILRPLSISLLMLLIACTTPMVPVFRLASKIMGKELASILFITYRYFFILSDRFDNMVSAIYVRGGYRSFMRTSFAGSLLGSLLIQSIDMAEQLNNVLEARGFRGEFPERRNVQGFCSADMLPAAIILLSIMLYLYTGGFST